MLAKSMVQKKDAIALHAKLGHSLEIIILATSKTMGNNLTHMFNPCNNNVTYGQNLR